MYDRTNPDILNTHHSMLEDEARTRGFLQAIQEDAVQQAVAALVTAEMIEEAAIEEAQQVVLAALTVEDEVSGGEDSA